MAPVGCLEGGGCRKGLGDLGLEYSDRSARGGEGRRGLG